MKHDIQIIVALTILFLATQIVGLALLNIDIQVKTTPTGQQAFHGETVVGPRPEVAGAETLIMVLVSVLIGTGLLLLLIRFGKIGWWKILYFLAVFLTISIALGVLAGELALIIALAFAVLKVFRPNVIIHNLTEVLIYSGLVILFAPLFQLVWIALLLIVISIYDMFAVWKSGHMIKIAKSLTDTKIFAGFSISYKSRAGRPVKSKEIKRKEIREKIVKVPEKTAKIKLEKSQEGGQEISQAMLGGGDVAFPLLFSGVVMETLINVNQLAKELAFIKALIIPIVVTIFLIGLFILGKRGRFYPAMPFITIACFIGLGLLSLV